MTEVVRGEPVYREGNPPGGISWILSGGVAALVGMPKLAPRVGHVFRSGDWFGTGPKLRGGNRTVDLQAIETSKLFAVPLVTLQDMAAGDPEAFRRVGDLSDERLLIACNTAAELLIPWSDRRIAAILLRVTDAADGVMSEHPGGFPLTQIQLAEMANVSRGLVNMTLKRFRESGWVQQRYKRIRIVDCEALSRFACSED